MNRYGGVPQPGGKRNRSFAELTGVSWPQDLLPFAIPDLDRDLPKGMYMTAALAAKNRSPTVRAMFDDARTFFRELDDLLVRARKGDRIAHAEARRRLGQFPEVSELGFGYSKSNWSGSGVGDGSLGEHLFQTLLNYPELSRTCGEEPDALAFIPLVDLDRCSDIFGTIVKRRLIEYTMEQVARFRFTNSCMRTVIVPGVWDARARKLVSMRAELPVTDHGRTVLLVEGKVVRSSPPVRQAQYTRLYHGNVRSLTKEEVLEDAQLHPGRLLNAIRTVLKDDWRYRPRREFRED